MDPDSFAAKKHKEHKNFSGVVATDDVSRRKFDFNWHKLTSRLHRQRLCAFGRSATVWQG
jgi:hypothetical protein